MDELTCRKGRRLLILIHGALALYEAIAAETATLLEKQPEQHLAINFDSLGSALHWMRKELEEK